MIRKSASAQPKSIQTRLTRVIVVILMGTFVIIGAIALFGIRANARAELSLDHRSELFDIRNALNGEFQDILSDLRRIASSSASRTFASQTVSISNVSADTQQRLTSEFIALLQQRPNTYAEVRYVTRSGSVWTEVTNMDGMQVNTQVALDELANDDALVYSLRMGAGNGVLGQVLFQRDAAGQLIRPAVPLLRFSAPVSLLNNVENIAGAVQVDVYADALLDIVNEHPLTLPGRRYIMVMAPGQTIADTLAPELTFTSTGRAGPDSSFSFNEPELDVIVRSAASDFTFAERGGRVFSATAITLENSPTMPWFLLLTDDSAVALGRTDALGIAAAVASLFAGGLISLLAVAIMRRTLRPLNDVTLLARQVTAGSSAPMSITPGSSDELGEVMNAFAEMSNRVQSLNQELETQVGRYSRNLEIAARIGRETATLYQMEPLLNRAINLIVDEFGYYHAQVFLVDDVGQNALLRYSHGALGQRLLEETHKIAVGSQSVIGTVTATAKPVVVNDTENDPGVHRFNPLLPDTRAEMAVPLQIGERVIGALDIQSKQANAFNEDDVQTFQLLADQIAVAINNAELLQQTEDRVDQIDNLNRQLTRTAWSEDNPLALQSGYQYDLFNIAKIEAPPTEEGVSAEIAIRGEVVGALSAVPPEGQDFSDGDMAILRAVSERVALAIENARLFRSTEISLQETSLLYDASRALGDANSDLDIVNIVAEYLVDDTTNLVMLTTLSGTDWSVSGVNARIAALWQRNPDEDLALKDLTLPAQQFPAWQQFVNADLLLIENVSSDPRLTPADRLGLFGMDMQAAAILPLRAGRRDLGALILGWDAPRRFDDREERVYSAFAEQASLKLEASRLLAQTERRARQLATSAEVGRVASTILNLDELLPRMVDLIKDAFGYDHTQVFLMSDDDTYAELRASTGEPGRQLLAINHKLAKGSSSVIGQVTETGAPSIALDTRDASVVHKPNPYLPDTRSEMAVPLVIKGQVVGALDVQSNQPNAFDQDDISVLTTLATQISVAIDNARLFEQSGRRASEMSFLFNVTTAAASADTLERALQNVAQELLRSLDALSVSLYLPQDYEHEDTTRTILHPVALAGPDQPISELSDIEVGPDNRNLIASLADARQSMILDHVDQVTSYIPAVDGARSAVVVPLTSGSTLVGLVAVEAAEPEAYDNDTLTLLLTLAGTLSTIVQNQQLLEQLQETNDQLRELDKLKSDFLANMSHELRTPLNSIIGFSRVILKGIDGPLTEMQEQDLTTIYNSGQHLLSLINDILDQAKISAQKMEMQLEPFAVKPVIDAVRSIGIGLIKDKPIDIVVDLASGLPAAFGDELRTRQILLNLVSNAAKFTREGTITLRAYTEADAQTGQTFVRIDVSDTGIGIAAQDIPLLFEAFRQVDSSLTRTVGGTGLGLPIARSLCEMQGGKLLVESVVNVGSTFSVLVPTEPADHADSNGNGASPEVEVLGGQMETRPTPRMVPPQSMETGMLPMLTKRQILLIEDNPDMVDQFRRILGREGFDIFAATITLEAEAMASGLHPTIIIMDVNFAGGVGWEILQRLKGRDDTLDIPVIVVTLSEEVDAAMEAGAFRVIQRPFAPEALVQAVHDADHESHIDRILIIDDQPESVRLLEQILQENGDFRVFGAHSGQDGIALVARRRPNLVILDLRMPEMDGFAVAEELRANPETAKIPILVVTGETLTEAERERLRNLDVMHKVDINLDAYLPFMEGVRMHLARAHGVN
jgi:signal transduction histidine kinase/CheY-like chemotaxis protein/HAMP domain-containing protein